MNVLDQICKFSGCGTMQISAYLEYVSFFCTVLKYTFSFLRNLHMNGTDYADGTGNTVEENSSVFSLMRMR